MESSGVDLDPLLIAEILSKEQKIKAGERKSRKTLFGPRMKKMPYGVWDDISYKVREEKFRRSGAEAASEIKYFEEKYGILSINEFESGTSHGFDIKIDNSEQIFLRYKIPNEVKGFPRPNGNNPDQEDEHGKIFNPSPEIAEHQWKYELQDLDKQEKEVEELSFWRKFL